MADEAETAPAYDERAPRVGRAAFVCPHCKAFAQQHWFELLANEPKSPPAEYSAARVREVIKEQKALEKQGQDAEINLLFLEELAAAVEERRPRMERLHDTSYSRYEVSNAQLSSCFVCKKIAVWVGGRVVSPPSKFDVEAANEDLPSDIRRDYEEAAEVLAASPRAAAALLRLAIQKVCIHLLDRRGAINEMIADLVKRGLSPLVQRALDVVRVVGNEAVHPGTIDLLDDHDTAMKLFGLVNLIGEAMISQPKHVAALYSSLPPEKLAAIAKRDTQESKA